MGIVPVLTKERLSQYIVLADGKFIGVGCNLEERGAFTHLCPWMDSNGEMFGGASIETSRISGVTRIDMPKREPVGDEQWAVQIG